VAKLILILENVFKMARKMFHALMLVAKEPLALDMQ
jgi:hypothetical protein